MENTTIIVLPVKSPEIFKVKGRAKNVFSWIEKIAKESGKTTLGQLANIRLN